MAIGLGPLSERAGGDLRNTRSAAKTASQSVAAKVGNSHCLSLATDSFATVQAEKVTGHGFMAEGHAVFSNALRASLRKRIRPRQSGSQYASALARPAGTMAQLWAYAARTPIPWNPADP